MKIVMEKVEGLKLLDYINSYRKLKKEETKKMIESAKSICLYLFEKKIFWRDLHSENAIIEKSSQDLKIFDFGAWREEKNISELTFRLLLGSIELIQNILNP